MNVKIKIDDLRLGTRFPLPSYATEGAAAIDLQAMVEEPLTVAPGQRLLVPSGLRVELPAGLTMLILPRSGLGANRGVVIGNLVGLIDPDYRGVVKISVWNTGTEEFVVEPGDRIAQALFVPFVVPSIEFVSELSETARAEGGFGHTSKE